MLGPFLVMGGLMGFSRINNIQKIFLIFSLPIIFIVLIEAVIVRANANWAAPALISLFAYLYVGNYNSLLKIMNYLFNFSFCLIFFIMIGINYPSNIFDRISGLNEYANTVYNISQKSFIKNMVISDRLLFSSLNYELRDKDINFYMPHDDNGKITNHFKMTSPLDKNMRRNFILIGGPSDIKYLKNEYSLVRQVSPIQKFTKRKFDVYEIIFK